MKTNLYEIDGAVIIADFNLKVVFLPFDLSSEEFLHLHQLSVYKSILGGTLPDKINIEEWVSEKLHQFDDFSFEEMDIVDELQCIYESIENMLQIDMMYLREELNRFWKLMDIYRSSLFIKL